MGEGGGGGAISYDGEKAWSSINHSILSALDGPLCPVFLTNLEGKVGKVGKGGKVGKVGKVGRVGKVGKVGKEGKEGRLRE
jgi:hypothetical protein